MSQARGGAPVAAPSVCMFVYNRCTNDARVLKEAASLRDAGYAVTILAVLVRDVVAEEEVDGIRIVRIERDPIHYRLLRRTRERRRLARLRRARRRRWVRARARRVLIRSRR